MCKEGSGNPSHRIYLLSNGIGEGYLPFKVRFLAYVFGNFLAFRKDFLTKGEGGLNLAELFVREDFYTLKKVIH